MAHKKRYLDPKNDLTFRRVFGEHPHLVKSFLNSMLPLEPDQQIEHIEYLEPELIPELPGLKRSIVDVHCTDNHGRIFIVEMQMYWTSAFKQRMLFNTGKAYVRQLKQRQKYRELKPVYGLSLVDDIMHRSEELKDVYYHHYKLVHTQVNNETIEGLELIFVELPKFTAVNHNDKRLQTLWLRFLTEVDELQKDISPDLLVIDEIREALEYVELAAFSEEELRTYDVYWDWVRVDKEKYEQFDEAEQKNKELLAANQRANAKVKVAEEQAKAAEEQAKAAEEQAKVAEQSLISTIQQMNKMGLTNEQIVQITGKSHDEIRQILSE